jgi:hypothetical protein
MARGCYHGIRMPGTNVPGVITAGTFYHDGKRVFWDVYHTKTIVIASHDERFNELMWKWMIPTRRLGSSKAHCEASISPRIIACNRLSA